MFLEILAGIKIKQTSLVDCFRVESINTDYKCQDKSYLSRNERKEKSRGRPECLPFLLHPERSRRVRQKDNRMGTPRRAYTIFHLAESEISG